MSVLRVPRQHGITRAAMQFIEAAETFGEEFIILKMYHPVSDAKREKCPYCYDDVYKQTQDASNCHHCWGTGIKDGVEKVVRVWGVFTDNETDETYGKRGDYEPDNRNFQCEAYPTIDDHDFIVRVKEWSQDHRPLILGPRYENFNVQEVTLRVGNRYGQQGIDKFAQKSSVKMLPGTHLMQDFPLPEDTPILRDSSSPYFSLS